MDKTANILKLLRNASRICLYTLKIWPRNDGAVTGTPKYLVCQKLTDSIVPWNFSLIRLTFLVTNHILTERISVRFIKYLKCKVIN